jgi:hypothetical protein
MLIVLRRHTDKIAACLAILLLAIFLAGAPVLSVMAGRAWATRPLGARSWRQVSAVLLRAAPPVTGWVYTDPLVPARWTAPDGRMRTGRIPVSLGLAVGRTVLLWVNAAGSPVGPPLKHQAVLAREAAAAVFVPVALGWVLLCLAEAGRWVLDRRRLADWETAWAATGPPVDQAFLAAGLGRVWRATEQSRKAPMSRPRGPRCQTSSSAWP